MGNFPKHNQTLPSLYSLDPPSPFYVKPFRLYRYNLPKLPPPKEVKAVPSYKDAPTFSVIINNATRMRNLFNQHMSSRTMPPHFVYDSSKEDQLRRMGKDSSIIPKHTKSSQFRYKWARDIPVISCRFIGHLLTYEKPPFTNERKVYHNACGWFKLRNMTIKEPVKVDVPVKPTNVS